jgi:3-oxoacyl-[acyl-carrier protein] reductase
MSGAVMSKASELAQDVALVTGASRGIGRAIAHELAIRGATVIGTATSESGAEAISQTFKDAGFKGRGLMLNVATQASVDALLGQLEQGEGAPSILVNNAGVTRDNLLLRMKPDEWDEIINTNLGSVYRMSKAVLRGMMKARRGRIVNIASIVGVMGNAGQTNYAAAKAGIIGFSKSLAREVGSRGITVNVVAPGFIATDMTAQLPAEQQQQLVQQVALGRLGSVEDIAHAVAFLASPHAGYITGETLHVNGGMYMV